MINGSNSTSSECNTGLLYISYSTTVIFPQFLSENVVVLIY
jgi:hypothetical protein